MNVIEFIKKRWFGLIIAIPSLALVLLETVGITYSSDPIINNLLRVIVTRFVGCFVFVPLAVYMKYNIFGSINLQ